MAHVGLVCPPMHGHMNPMFALGRKLVRRGHRVTVLSLADARRKTEAAGLPLYPLGLNEFPAGSIPERTEELGQLTGVRAVLFTVRMIRRENQVQLDELPVAARALGVDVLAVDQTSPGAVSVAESLGIPHVTVCNAMMIDQELSVPPVITHWQYSSSLWGRVRNWFGYGGLRLVARPVLNDVNKYRERHSLPRLRNSHGLSSKLAIVSQAPAAFDYPRQRLKPWFHYTGPFQEGAGREPSPFPYERLDGRPLIYASLGTLQNRVEQYFHTMAAACAEMPVQLAIGLGGADPARLGNLPGEPIVVGYAPQLDLLERAALTITHAGMNTVLESLTHGVPVVAIPITNDQPGIASRVEWHGVGERILPQRLTVDRLRAAIQRVLFEPSYREHALEQQKAIAATDGASAAAQIIERVLETRAPVLREDFVPEEQSRE